jgi:hypothetical protein
VVGTEAAVIGASPFHGRVVNHRHFRSLDKNFTAAAVIVDIVRNQDAFRAVLMASLKQVDVAVLKDDLALHLRIALRADGERNVVEEIWPGPGHECTRVLSALRPAIIRTKSRAQ